MARGRKPDVRYWPTRKGGGYFVTIGRKQVELALGPDDAPTGPTYLSALDKYLKLRSLETNKGTNDYLVSALANRYRMWLADKHPRRLDLFEQWGKSFIARYGPMKCCDLRPFHFHDWLDEHPQWGPTSRRNAAVKVMACINWGAKCGLIQSNHLLRQLQLPELQLRGKEMRMPAELMDLLIALAFSKAFRLFLRVLRETGCRPIELRMADIAENLRGDRLVFPWNSKRYRHKTSAKTKRDRTIYLTPELAQDVREAMGDRRQGYLFLGPRGKPYGARNMFKQWERIVAREEVQAYLRQHAVKPEHVQLYSFRHTFASEWIDSGRSLKVCADLMGTSVAMLERCYGHPDANATHQHYLAFMAQQNCRQ